MPNPLLSQLDPETKQRLIDQAQEAIREGIPAETVMAFLDDHAETFLARSKELQGDPDLSSILSTLGSEVSAPGQTASGLLGDLIAPTPQNLLALPASFVTGPLFGRLAAGILPNAGIKRLAIRFLTDPRKLEFGAAERMGVEKAFGAAVRISEEPQFLLSLSKGFGVALPFAATDAAEAAFGDEVGHQSPAAAFATTTGIFLALDAILFQGLPLIGRSISRLLRRRISQEYVRRVGDPVFTPALERLERLQKLKDETLAQPVAERITKVDGIDETLAQGIKRMRALRTREFNEAMEEIGRQKDTLRRAADIKRGEDEAQRALEDIMEEAAEKRIKLDVLARDAEGQLGASQFAEPGQTISEIEADFIETLMRRTSPNATPGGGLPAVAQAVDSAMRRIEIEAPQAANAIKTAFDKAKVEKAIGESAVEKTIETAIKGTGTTNVRVPGRMLSKREAAQFEAESSIARPNAVRLLDDPAAAAAPVTPPSGTTPAAQAELTEGLAVNTPSGRGVILDPNAFIGGASVSLENGRTALIGRELIEPIFPTSAIAEAKGTATAVSDVEHALQELITEIETKAGPGGGLPRDISREAALPSGTTTRFNTPRTGRAVKVTTSFTRRISSQTVPSTARRKRTLGQITSSPGDLIFIGAEDYVIRASGGKKRVEIRQHLVRFTGEGKGDPVLLLISADTEAALKKKFPIQITERWAGRQDTQQEGLRLAAGYQRSLLDKRRGPAQRDLLGPNRNPDAPNADIVAQATLEDGITNLMIRKQKQTIGVKGSFKATTKEGRITAGETGPESLEIAEREVARRAPSVDPADIIIERDRQRIESVMEATSKPDQELVLIEAELTEAGAPVLRDFTEININAAFKNLDDVANPDAVVDYILAASEEAGRKGLVVEGIDKLALDQRAVKDRLTGRLAVHRVDGGKEIPFGSITDFHNFITRYDPKDEATTRKMLADIGAGWKEFRNKDGGC